MTEQLFVSASNGIYIWDKAADEAVCVLGKQHTSGWLRRKSRGYFGICAYDAPHKVLVASRERLSMTRHNKPTTDTKLFAIDTNTLKSECVATVRDIHDIHQICYHHGYVYLTDTGKNRVVVYDLMHQRVLKYLNIGQQRDDIHHINAMLIDEGYLYIGLNNRGKESQVLKVCLTTVLADTRISMDILENADVEALEGMSHTHDLEKCDDMLLCCSSHKGLVVNIKGLKTPQIVIHADMWVRGLASNRETLWVGASFIASRKERHGKEVDGIIYQYRKHSWEMIKTYTIKGSGQINDLILV